jgi:hypothetical protein
MVESAVFYILLDMEEWTEVEDRLDEPHATVFWDRLIKLFDRIEPIIVHGILRCIPAESESTGPSPSSESSGSLPD